MLGAIVGDVVGSRFEFAPHKLLDFELLHPDCHFTDDSVLTLATASALVDGENFVDVYRLFARRYPEAGYGKRFTTWFRSDTAQAYNSYGNGSAMRVAPVAWFASTETETLDLAEQSACATHDHPEGIKGAQAVALGIFLARQGMEKEQLRRRLEVEFGYDLQRSTSHIRPYYSFDVSCQGSVPEALICFLESHDFTSALRLAISLGGDADTQAAIAGSLSEAYYGNIPSDILEFCISRLDPFLNEQVRRFEVRVGRSS